MTAYTLLLAIHSFFRWIVLTGLLLALVQAYRGWLAEKPYTAFQNTIRHTTATIAHIQLLLGLSLYFISPLVKYFLQNFKEAVHDREIRFFGMEHSLMMVLAVTIITIGSVLAKRKTNDKEKFKTQAIWFTIALLVILSNIPWPFSPLVNRPYLRGF